MVSLFDKERKRDLLAKSNNLVEFKRTYISKGSGLEDLNTRGFWDTKVHESCDTNTSCSPVYSNKMQIVLKYLQKKKGNLLDVGFGYGYLERALYKHDNTLSLHGIDISYIAVSKINKVVKGDFKVGNIYKLKYESSFFDFVLALDILEHLSADKIFAAYSELYRILKTGGKMIVSVPLNEGLEEMIKKGSNPNGHLRAYTPNILRAELKLSGFEILEEHYLYAFKIFYLLKNLIIKLLPIKIRQPNLMIVLVQKA